MEKGYKHIGLEELTRHFFGVGYSEVEEATENEKETFLFLLETKEELAIDFLNCWLISRNLKPLSDNVLKSARFAGIIKENSPKKSKIKKIKKDKS